MVAAGRPAGLARTARQRGPDAAAAQASAGGRPRPGKIVVIGGGLAGITAAIALARPAPASRCSRPGPGWAGRPARSAAAG